jgi:trans-aconitate methyltransferase
VDIVEASNRTKLLNSRHPWELARLEVVIDLLNKHINKKNISSIVDIGCGDTFFIDKMADYYPQANCYAVDTAFNKDLITAYEAKVAGKKIKLFNSTDSAQLEIKEKASVILLLDVIEHIENDIDFLSNLIKYDFVGKDTIIIISVPAFQKLFCNHDVFLGHYRRYTNNLLLKHVQQAGLKKKKIGYFFTILVFVRIAQVLKEKWFGKKNDFTGLVEWQGGVVKSTFLKNLLLLDYKLSSALRIIGIKLPGLSNYIICQKPA